MKSWKTTLVGLLAAVATAGYAALQGGITGEALIMALALAALGFFAKDFNVSGGGK